MSEPSEPSHVNDQDLDARGDTIEDYDEFQDDDLDVPDALEPATPEEPAIEVRQPTFTDAGAGLDALDDATPLGRDNALQKLGRPPFERSGRTKFRLLGFLATVYEHVADDLKHAVGDPEPEPEPVGAESTAR